MKGSLCTLEKNLELSAVALLSKMRMEKHSILLYYT